MKQTFAALCIGLLAIASAPADAVQIRQTYTGSVGSGNDVEGVFGAAGSDLGGLAFTAVFTFETGAGNSTTGPISPGTGVFVQLAGGTSTADPFLGTPTPLLSATLSIGGSAPVTIAGGSEDRTVVRSSTSPGVSPSEYLSSTLGSNGDVLSVFVRSFAAVYPANLSEPGTYLASPGAVVGDQFRLVNPGTFSDSARGSLAPTSLVVAVVPEPGTLLLMTAGIAALGGLRRRLGMPGR